MESTDALLKFEHSLGGVLDLESDDIAVSAERNHDPNVSLILPYENEQVSG